MGLALPVGDAAPAAGEGFDRKVLIRVAEVDGRWVSTGVVIHAQHVDTQVMKAASNAVSLVVNLLNANPDGLLGKASARASAALSAAIAKMSAEPVFAVPPTTQDRPRLTRPDGSDPDAYYELVAAAYADAVALRQSPAAFLAGEAGVPIATARGWIREARRRGALNPGRRKAAGGSRGR